MVGPALQAVEGENEETFVREVVAGCCQHSQLIKVFCHTLKLIIRGPWVIPRTHMSVVLHKIGKGMVYTHS